MSLQQVVDVSSSVGVPVYNGYAATAARVPYVVVRPMTLDPLQESVGGPAMVWDTRYALYAVAGSVAASYNLAVSLLQVLNGARISGSYMSASLGYVGALTEGAYETQVTTLSMKGSL